tara:strand:+ start:197 stop:1114 length:918 start_codon:yes stop_codon:yes gene_type:complete
MNPNKAIHNWYKILIYFSLLSVFVYILTSDFFFVPNVKSTGYLLKSLLFLFLGFLFDSFNWGAYLKKRKSKQINYADSLVSHGITIFSKYIPGKIWMIIGRAGFIANKYNFSTKQLSLISFEVQIISLWSGLIVSSVTIFFLQESKYFLILLIGIFCLLIGLSIFLFTNFFQKILQVIIKKLFKIDFTNKKPEITIYNLIGFYGTWVMWSLSFYFLEKALFDREIVLITGLAFVFAANIGLVAIIFPGGVGIREGILVAILINFEFTIAEATTISLVSRLWFLSGEVFIFLTSLIIQKFKPNLIS